MFINYKFNREEESIVISDTHGIMDIKEYQDNIEDILVLEDVIEGLESELSSEKNKQYCLIQKFKDSIARIQEFKKERKRQIASSTFWILIAPIIFSLAIESLCKIYGLAPIDNSYIKRPVLCGLVGDLFFCFTQIKPLLECRLSKLKKLSKKKTKILKQIFESKRYISVLNLVISENKEKLNILIENKRKDNIETTSTKVQTISYREMLEKQKEYLKQMYHDKYELPKEEKENENTDMVLGRFKKRKKGN